MEEILTYNNIDGWVGYIEEDSNIFMSAHTDNSKYSFGMLRAIVKLADKLNVFYTILPTYELELFYSKLYDIELVDVNSKLYKVKGRRWE